MVADPASEFVPFDYAEPAELYLPVLLGRGGGLDYRRFLSAALALQYAVESIDPRRLASAALEVAGVRYDHRAIRRFYDAFFQDPSTAGAEALNKAH